LAQAFSGLCWSRLSWLILQCSFCCRHGVSSELSGIPWFRVHGIILNDPGRLISVHLTHTAVIAGWAGSSVLFESVMTDDSDEMFNPCWRQGMSVWPFCTRLGLLLGALGTFHSKSTGLDVGISSHTSLAGLVLLAGTWHWAFWDLDMFVLKQVLSMLCLGLKFIRRAFSGVNLAFGMLTRECFLECTFNWLDYSTGQALFWHDELSNHFDVANLATLSMP